MIFSSISHTHVACHTRHTSKIESVYMRRFPRDFGGSLVCAAVIQCVAGVLKCRLRHELMFWISIIIEFISAMFLGVTLVIQVLRGDSDGGYSRVEKAAAFLTICVDVILLLQQALVSYYFMINSYRNGIIPILVFGAILVLSAIPAYIGMRKRASWTRFNSSVSARILLAIAVIPAISIVSIFYSASLVPPAEFVGEYHLFWHFLLTFIKRCSRIGWILFFPLVLYLGFIILSHRDNLSLVMLVFVNLYPALLVWFSLFYPTEVMIMFL